ncbi:hypothetical protein R1sor_021666 [Riccia sorocarpa]|uniref:Uncharacterized protein n=1 Tax=Riccia sorocarpa TaxID=122646 RepID=A0ABD3GKT6_9MARC
MVGSLVENKQIEGSSLAWNRQATITWLILNFQEHSVRAVLVQCAGRQHNHTRSLPFVFGGTRQPRPTTEGKLVFTYRGEASLRSLSDLILVNWRSFVARLVLVILAGQYGNLRETRAGMIDCIHVSASTRDLIEFRCNVLFIGAAGKHELLSNFYLSVNSTKISLDAHFDSILHRFLVATKHFRIPVLAITRRQNRLPLELQALEVKRDEFLAGKQVASRNKADRADREEWEKTRDIMAARGVVFKYWQVKNKYGNLLTDFRKVHNWKGRTGNPSYWEMSASEKRAERLPPKFPEQWFDLMFETQKERHNINLPCLESSSLPPRNGDASNPSSPTTPVPGSVPAVDARSGETAESHLKDALDRMSAKNVAAIREFRYGLNAKQALLKFKLPIKPLRKQEKMKYNNEVCTSQFWLRGVIRKLQIISNGTHPKSQGLARYGDVYALSLLSIHRGAHKEEQAKRSKPPQTRRDREQGPGAVRLFNPHRFEFTKTY